MEKLVVLVVLAFHYVSAHQIYENECPADEPMPDFDMNKVKSLTKSVHKKLFLKKFILFFSS